MPCIRRDNIAVREVKTKLHQKNECTRKRSTAWCWWGWFTYCCVPVACMNARISFSPAFGFIGLAFSFCNAFSSRFCSIDNQLRPDIWRYVFHLPSRTDQVIIEEICMSSALVLYVACWCSPWCFLKDRQIFCMTLNLLYAEGKFRVGAQKSPDAHLMRDLHARPPFP